MLPDPILHPCTCALAHAFHVCPSSATTEQGGTQVPGMKGPPDLRAPQASLTLPSTQWTQEPQEPTLLACALYFIVYETLPSQGHLPSPNPHGVILP